MPAVGFALAALIGLALGLLGAGGSILTVPILVYVLRFEPKQAIAMSLLVVGITSLAGMLGYLRLGQVRLRAGLAFGAGAMSGAYLGARLATFVSARAQLALLGLAMFGAALSMFRGRRAAMDDAASCGAPRAQTPVVAATGLGVGVLTGLAGVGGGFLIVPALVLFLDLPMKQAVGTSLLVITLSSAAAFSGYAGRVRIPWEFVTAFTPVAVSGIIAGTWIVRFVSQAALRRAFAVLLVAAGVFVLYTNRSVPAVGARPPVGAGPARVAR